MEYTTKRGDRLDLIASRYLFTPQNYRAIIQSNPLVPITVNLQPGIKLHIPNVRKQR